MDSGFNMLGQFQGDSSLGLGSFQGNSHPSLEPNSLKTKECSAVGLFNKGPRSSQDMST